MSKALQAAIEANDPDAVSKAVKGMKDLNRRLPGAKSPLLHACTVGADKVLESLFKAGAVAEKRNTFPGDTPFAVAAAHKQFAVMKQLLALKRASEEAVSFVIENACMDGNADVLRFALEEIKPRITIQIFRLASVSSNAPTLLKMLAEHGGNVNARYDTSDAKSMTPLHDRAGSGKAAVIRTLIECGADVNARDGLGRTPLMILAENLEGIEIANERAEMLKPLIESGAARVHGEMPKVVDALDAIRTLLEAGADASLSDHAGNDAIDHCVFEYRRCDKEPPAEIIKVLREAGARGDEVTLNLFKALKRKDLAALREAIAKGADVNRLTPPPVPFTPLVWAAGSSAPDALEFVQALLQAGADANKKSRSDTPLIQAARSGNLAIVRALLEARANLHAVMQSGEYIENAYSAARNDEVRKHLKSLGATNPVRPEAEPLKPGVHSWNDFSELLVKAAVETVAAALAKMIKGKTQLNAYGQSVIPGKEAFVIVQPSGMDWCNVFQIAPPRLRIGDEKKTETIASTLAKMCGASVLVIEYSDTSDAASILRIEPDGKTAKDAGWDRESLQEMADAMGNEAPAWVKKQLAKTGDDEPRSTERLVMLAEQEKFVVAAFGLQGETGRAMDIEITGLGEDAFDAVAFVTN
jgi:ankyrin repeat protein